MPYAGCAAPSAEFQELSSSISQAQKEGWHFVTTPLTYINARLAQAVLVTAAALGPALFHQLVQLVAKLLGGLHHVVLVGMLQR
jgi:hypothetical protein